MEMKWKCMPMANMRQVYRERKETCEQDVLTRRQSHADMIPHPPCKPMHI
jgi:hypothetical protein